MQFTKVQKRQFKDDAVLWAKRLTGAYDISLIELHRLTCEKLGVHRSKAETKNQAKKKLRAVWMNQVTVPPPPPRSKAPPESDEFLRSYQWRQLRLVVLKKYGSRCQCCGASPATGAVINVDHIKPRKLFPALALDANNLQVLCDACNHGKGNWDMSDFRKPRTRLLREGEEV